MTETSPGATSLSPPMTRTKQGSVGLPHFFTDVRIADEHGGMVPRGTVGEIEIPGPNVFPGYLTCPRPRRMPSPRTAGSAPATSATSTRTDTSTSPTG